MRDPKGRFTKGPRPEKRKPAVFRDCPNCEKNFKVSRNNPSTKYCCHGCSVEHLLKGKKKSTEHKRKIKENHAKHWAHNKMSEKHIEKMTKGLKDFQSGERHWNWKGGITPKLKSYRCKKWYTDWRNGVYERDDYTCAECGEKGGNLCAHHKIPFAELVFNNDVESLEDISNGITLCKECHVKTDSYAKRFT